MRGILGENYELIVAFNWGKAKATRGKESLSFEEMIYHSFHFGYFVGCNGAVPLRGTREKKQD